MSDQPGIPTDRYSRTLRAVKENPASLVASSTVHARDFYGNEETYVLDTYRTDDGRTTVFVQVNNADGGTRFVLPAEIMAAIFRHNDQLIGKARKRAARRAVETRRERQKGGGV